MDYVQETVKIPGAGVPYRELLLVCLVSAFVTFIFTSLIRPIARRMGAIAIPRERDVHELPTARWGGIAMYLGVVVGFLVARQLPALTRGFQFSSEISGFIWAGAIIVIVGLIDDRFGIDALTKLLGQITASLVLVTLGVSWYILYIPGVGTVVLDVYQAGLLTIFMCVAMTNAINFLDGLDGLAAGLVGISMSGIAILSLRVLSDQGGDVSYYPPALISILVVGGCLGFLPHNFYRAKIFMGDSGALFLGLALATAAISSAGKVSRGSYGVKDVGGLISPLIITIAVIALPAFDIISVIIQRKRRGLKIFAPDKMHIHHKLLDLGHSHKRAVIVVYLWCFLLTVIAQLITIFPVWQVIIIAIVGSCIVIYATFGEQLKNKFKKTYVAEPRLNQSSEEDAYQAENSP